MGLLLWLLGAGCPNSADAIPGADLFFLIRVHDPARPAGRDQLQHRSFLFGRLERRNIRSQHSTYIFVSEQQWVYAHAKQRQLFVGDADRQRLRVDLSLQFLRNRFQLPQ